MSKPSFSNIDLWLFEYAEGNLTADQVSQLELFILQHPELDVDRDMWEMAHVNKQNAQYEDVAALYKRTPVNMYWALSGGVAALFALFFVSYSFFVPADEFSFYAEQLHSTENSTEKYAADVAWHASTENRLQAEVDELKVLVASLENELKNSRNNGGSDLDSFGSQTLAITNETAVATKPNKNAEANINIPNVADGNTEHSELSSLNTVEDENAVTSIETISFTNTLTEIAVLRPRVLQELVKNASPVSRTLMAEHEQMIANNDETTNQGQNGPVSVDYENSYKYKLSRFVRNVRKMANNPIALKNYRDPYHHVPGMTSLDANFGATGTMIAPRFQAMSRLQGRGGVNELFSNQIAFDGYVYDMRGGIGVQMTHNYYNNGGIQSGEVAITYSPKFSVNQKLSIEPALRFKMGNKMLDANRMEGQSQVEYIPGNTIDYYTDGTTPVGRMLWYRDMGFGLNVNTEWFYASAQVDNIFQHGDNLYSNNLDYQRRAGTYFVATLGTDWESNDSQWETKRSKFSLSPYLVYRNFENINELWAGANFRAYWLTVGAAVSSNMDPSASLGIVSSDKRFSLTYNADYARSMLTNERALSHQLTLRLVGKQNRVGRRH